MLPVTPGEVYDAFIDPKKHSEFTGGKATGKAKVGGKFTAWDGYILGVYLELVPHKKIVQEWMTTDWEKGYPPSRLVFQFAVAAKGMKLTLLHSGIPASQKKLFAQGWKDFYWEPLKKYYTH